MTLSKLTTVNQLLCPGAQGVEKGEQMDARLFLPESEYE